MEDCSRAAVVVAVKLLLGIRGKDWSAECAGRPLPSRWGAGKIRGECGARGDEEEMVARGVSACGLLAILLGWYTSTVNRYETAQISQPP